MYITSQYNSPLPSQHHPLHNYNYQHVFIDIYMHKHSYIEAYMCIFQRVYIDIYTYIYRHIYPNTYIYTYTYFSPLNVILLPHLNITLCIITMINNSISFYDHFYVLIIIKLISTTTPCIYIYSL
jgi:hypothetical protein